MELIREILSQAREKLNTCSESIPQQRLLADLIAEAKATCPRCLSLADCPFQGLIPDFVRTEDGESFAYRHCDRYEELSRRQRREELLSYARLPEKLQAKSFENFSVLPGNQDAYRAAIAAEAGKEGLLLHGPPGVGKTHLAAAILNRRLENLRDGLFCGVPRLLADLRRAIAEKTLDEILADLEKVELLVLDDFGVERQTDWRQEQIYLVLESRLLYDRQTVITTNFSAHDLVQRFGITGERFMSRVHEMCCIAALHGPDFRVENAKRKANIK